MKNVLTKLYFPFAFFLISGMHQAAYSPLKATELSEAHSHAEVVPISLNNTLMSELSPLFGQDPQRTRSMRQADQNKALKARQSGKIIPYGQIARRAKKRFGGRIVNQSLQEIKPNEWVYKLKVLRKNGKVVNVTMDAQTGKFLNSRGERRR